MRLGNTKSLDFRPTCLMHFCTSSRVACMISNCTGRCVLFLAQHFGPQMAHVPYKGAAPAMMGLIGGETQLVPQPWDTCHAAG